MSNLTKNISNATTLADVTLTDLSVSDSITLNYQKLVFPSDTGSSGKVLTTDGAGILNWSAPPSGVTLLSALNDVVLNTVANGQSLIYESSSSKWKNLIPNISMMGDTNISSVVASDILQYDSISSKWVNKTAVLKSRVYTGGSVSLTTSDQQLLCSNTSSLTLTLPLVSGCAGHQYVIKKTGAGGILTIQSAGGNYIGENPTTSWLLSTVGDYIYLLSDGVDTWSVI